MKETTNRSHFTPEGWQELVGEGLKLLGLSATGSELRPSHHPRNPS